MDSGRNAATMEDEMDGEMLSAELVRWRKVQWG